MRQLIISILIFICYLNSPDAFAYYPLITDDATTISREKLQYEINLELGYESNLEGKISQSSFRNTLTYGIFNRLDFSVGLPFVYMREMGFKNNKAYGFSDIEAYLKYRIYEKNGLKIGLKPIIVCPTGDFKKGLGEGSAGAQIFLLVDVEVSKQYTIFLGYLRNENKIEEKKNLLKFSIAGDLEIVKNHYLVADSGTTSNGSANNNEITTFFLVGLCYLLSNDFDISFAFKIGLKSPELDKTILSGISIRF